MQFGLIVQMTGLLGYPQPLARLAREAAAAGWDGFFIWDVFGGDSIAPTPVVDPWIALAAIGATTEHIRFGPMVTPLPRRRPWKLAREAASLDHLSGGRLILGVGIGTPPEEFARFGSSSSTVRYCPSFFSTRRCSSWRSGSDRPRRAEALVVSYNFATGTILRIDGGEGLAGGET